MDPNVQFTLAEQFLSKLTHEKEADHFHVRIEAGTFDSSYSVDELLYTKEESGIEIAEMATAKRSGTDQPLCPHFILSPNMPPEEIKVQTDQDPMIKDLGEDKDFNVVRRSRCFFVFAISGRSCGIRLYP